jgi:hypothetical protein
MDSTRRAVLATAAALPVSLAGCLGWQASTDDALVDTTVEGEDTLEFEAEEGDRLSVDVSNDVGTLTQFQLRSPGGERLVDTATGSEYESVVEASTSGVYEVTVSTEGRATIVVSLA